MVQKYDFNHELLSTFNEEVKGLKMAIKKLRNTHNIILVRHMQAHCGMVSMRGKKTFIYKKSIKHTKNID